MTSRRIVLLAGAGVLLAPASYATPEALQAALRAFTGGRTPRDGRVTLEIADIRATVQHAMESGYRVGSEGQSGRRRFLALGVGFTQR